MKNRKLSARAVVSLMLSAILFCMPIGAFFANRTNTIEVHAEDTAEQKTESASDAENTVTPGNGREENSGTDTGEGKTENSTEGTTEDSSEETQPAAKCTCKEKCSQYAVDEDCEVCAKNYKECTYINPSVKITINTPSGWHNDTTKVTVKVEDTIVSGNFTVQTVKAKVGQNGSWTDITEDMYIEISENSTIYVQVTDQKGKTYEKNRYIKCFDFTKPTLNAAVSDGLLSIQAHDTDSGIKAIYVNGYEFTDHTNGALNIRLQQFDAGYQYFTISAMDNAGNTSEIYKTANPYYTDPENKDSNEKDPAQQLPVDASATKPMHECDEGYDYSILNEQYHLLDGGVYDNPDITIQRAMDMVIADLKEPRFSSVTEQYYRDEYLQGEVYAGSEAEIVDFVELSEKAEEVEQADLEAKQAEFRENNPDVVADFRAKTEELFHSLDGQSADDIEKTVYAYVQSQIDEYGLDAQIVDVVVSGSRCRGIEQENSDLDVVVEYTGSTREDDLFNMLHEDSIYIAGIQVDINPITESRTGTLETYLPEVETYLQEKAQQEQINNQLVTQGRELVQEQNALVSEGKVLSELEKEPVIEPETVHITFTVAECGEIHSMGEFHEGIETVEEAMKLYNAIDPSRMQGIPSIGVNMHIEGTEEWEDEQADIVSGKRIDVDFLNYTPELRDTPKVQDALKKLIAAFPEKEVNDRETKDQKIQALAAELDQLSYDIDTFEYRDSVPDREAQIQMIANDIRSGNVKPLQIFLQTSIDEGIDEDSERQAKELLVKLADYKPLAKIEELEEQNYNMIDNVLNNGVEKFNREEEKKEQQEKPQARSSLKERLATKQKEAAHGNNKDTKEQEKSKNSHREM